MIGTQHLILNQLSNWIATFVCVVRLNDGRKREENISLDACKMNSFKVKFVEGVIQIDIILVNDELAGGKKAFEIIAKGIEDGASVLGLATGSTPESLYQEMIKSDLSFEEISSINLDEYVGLDQDNPQSYHYYMDEKLFSHKNFKETHLPNGKAENLAEECNRYDQVIEENPIDIQILGIGHNAHIGFNEPGAPFDGATEVVELTESTINANKRYFDRVEDVPTEAVSMGIGSIVKSKKILLMAFGAEKAEAIKKTIEGDITTDVPASILQKHDDVVVILDQAAASKLSKETL